jgi:hypothetical protein
LVYARNLFLYHLVHPVLLLVRVVISPFVLFEKVISPNVFPADSEPIGYWLAAFKCVGQKVHHILRIPLSLIVWVDNWIDRAVIRIFETYAGPFVDLPPPGEAQVCGTGAGKAEMLDKLADLENNSEQAKQFVDELSRDAE